MSAHEYTWEDQTHGNKQAMLIHTLKKLIVFLQAHVVKIVVKEIHMIPMKMKIFR